MLFEQDTESFFQHLLFEEEEDGNDDDDPEKKRYAVYLSHVAKTPKESIICLMCFLEKGVSKTIPRSLVCLHSFVSSLTFDTGSIGVSNYDMRHCSQFSG
jgi:hypothetical protein